MQICLIFNVVYLTENLDISKFIQNKSIDPNMIINIPYLNVFDINLKFKTCLLPPIFG